MTSDSDPTIAYTDGACSGNPGPGGWAWAVPGGAFASGAAEHSTNQRMEIVAAYEAVRAIDGPLEIVSDSTYVVNCFRDRWWEGWIRRGWKNSQKKPVANRELWEPFIALVNDRGDVSFRWVKGHSGDEMNDLVDALAVEAAQGQVGRSGDEPPEIIGPADDVGWADRGSGAAATSKAAADSRRPAGHLLGVFGHRPPAIGGYGSNPVADDLRRRLSEIIAAKAEMISDLMVVSGLQLGSETLGVEAAAAAGVRYGVVVAFPDQESVWPKATQEHYRRLVEGAAVVIDLEKKRPESKAKVAAAMARRDGWLSRQLDEAVVVWDEQDPAIGKLYRTLDERLDGDVWLLVP